jgi:uncharacterized protein (DUF1697 family)
MTVYVAFLRAVNVGGTGKLAMSDLRVLCERLAFKNVQTYIASGNVIFASDLPEAEVKARLERALHTHAGKPVGVVLRTGQELIAILAANPFPDGKPNHTLVTLLDTAPPSDSLVKVTGQNAEELALGAREIYVHYTDGVGNSKLRIKAAALGTARNLNTIAKLAELAV